MNRQLFGLLLLLGTCAGAQPILDSWYVEGSRSYARIYQTLNDETARNSVTTWNRGQGIQSQPTYGGVHLVAHNDNNVYVGATGLGAHIMGPWYGNPQKTQLFPNYPAGRANYFRIPRVVSVPAVKTLTSLGAIGVFVDGVSMFDSRDAFSYSNAQGSDQSGNQGDGVWNSDAYVNESVTFDSAFAHQAGSQYHYHANPPGLRHLLGDNVSYDAVNNRYTEDASPTKHSPILGWVIDGLPVYGPYGYSDPTDSNSSITRMRSGYRRRNITVRETIPAWAARAQGRVEQLTANLFGPTTAGEPLGHYLEDNEYLGDVGFTLGVEFDLNEHNARFCKTPEFPDGTWAYFVNIESDGTPRFPYNIGRSYYATPNGGSINDLPGNATVHAKGGPESSPRFSSLARDGGNGDITLVWDGVEGGSYRIDSTTDFTTWTPMKVVESGTSIDRSAGFVNRKFYRASIDSVQPFSNAGFSSNFVSRALITISVTLNGNGPANLGTEPNIVLFNGAPAIFVSRPAQNVITLRVPEGLNSGSYPVAITFPDNSVVTGTHQVVSGNNVLLLIVDDWGIDSSPVDNVGGSNLPIMPNLTSLASGGVRFLNAYAQAQCSPTRAAILSGRYAFRTGVGSPGGVNFATSEVTLADALIANAGYAAGSVGKWHLGGGDAGPRDLGGWQYFAGSSGNVSSYTNWTKLSSVGISPPVSATNTTYATTENTTDAINWINSQGSSNWFAWVAYNAPHSPFHAAPAVVAGQNNPYATINNNRQRYESMLWAMDAEIGRLLSAVDLNSTTVIIIGDNGTPGGVIQAPFNNTHSKATLYEGGTHVPLVIAGKTVQSVNTTSDKVVHAVDLYSTILEIAGVNPTSLGVTLDSQSLIPVLNGSDTADRYSVCEAFGTDTNPGRAIRKDDYKLIIHDDPLITTDTAVLEFYHLSTDQNETNNLLAGTLTAAQQTAYNNLLVKNVALGGNFNNTPAQPVTFYAQLDPNATNPRVPNLTRNDNGNTVTVDPQSITVGSATATYVGRENQGGSADQFWVKATIEPASSGLQSGQSYPIVVTFPGQTARVFTALTQFVAP